MKLDLETLNYTCNVELVVYVRKVLFCLRQDATTRLSPGETRQTKDQTVPKYCSFYVYLQCCEVKCLLRKLK